jgi:hypothetical protein
MDNELLYAGAIAGIIEAIFWVGVGAYWLRRKMMKRKTKPKWDWAQRVADYRADYRKSVLNEAIDNEYYAVAYDADFPTQEDE